MSNQYYPQQQRQPYERLNPLIILGAVIFIAPFLGDVIHWNIPKWICGIGVVLVIAGSVIAIFGD